MPTNRYGDEYEFVKTGPDTYTIEGNLKHWRCGGKDQESLNSNDLGFVDPSGGPFVSLGSRVEGREVIQISISADDRVRLRVK
jgi:hypothetical protein